MSRKTRKLMWSVPLIAAVAVIGALAIFMAQTPDPAAAHGLPGAVTDLKAEADGYRAIDLTWTAPAGAMDITGYRVDMSKDGQIWMTLENDTESDANSFRDTYKLTGGTHRLYRVFAINSAGTGAVSRVVGDTTDAAKAPGPVKNLDVMANGQKEVILSWDPPDDDGGRDIVEYHIHWARAADAATPNPPAQNADLAAADVQVIVVKDGTGYTHKKRTAQQTYKYQVYAAVVASNSTNPVFAAASHKSAASPLRITMTDKATKPSAPLNLTAVSTGDGAATVNLYWHWPTDNGGVDLFDFEIQSSTNRIDWQASGSAVTVTTVQGTDYEAQVSTAAEGDTEYFRVRATNVGGDGTGDNADDLAGPWSNVASGTSGEVVPLALTTTDDDIAATRDSLTGVITIKWDRAGRTNPSSYRIDVAKTEHEWESLVDYTGFTHGEYRYTDTENENLWYRIFERALVDHDSDTATSSVIRLGLASADIPAQATASTSPGGVRGLMATGTSPTKITVSWNAPAELGGAPITSYCVNASTTKAGLESITASAACTAATADGPPATFVTVLTKDGDAVPTTYVHKNLDANTTWWYRVIPRNSADAATDAMLAVAEQVYATTMKVPDPMAPEQLVAELATDSNLTGRTNRGVNLLWNAPENPEGGMISGYRIGRKTGDDSWEIIASTVPATRTYYTDSKEPEADEMRQYRVAALTGSGSSTKVGPWSNVAYYPVMAHTHNTDPMKVGSIMDQTVTAGMSLAPMDVSGYFNDDDGDTLTYRAMSDMETYATVSVSGSMLTITGVAEGTATITVYASDGMGGTDAMQTFMVTVTSAMPMAPTEVMAQFDDSDPGNLKVTVTWKDGANVPAHGVVLFNSDFSAWPYIGRGTGGTHTFSNVARGSYNAVVVALDAEGGLLTDAEGNYLFAGAASSVVVQQ